jgi:hypothetical protein
MGWYWPLAVAAGIAVAVGLPWAFIRKARSSSGRWQRLAVTGYVVALGCGMTYYWGVRFNAPPVGVPVALPQPPLWFALVIAGLSAVGLTIAAIAVLLLVILVEAIAPGLGAQWLRAWVIRRTSAPRKQRRFDKSIPARLRLVPQDGGPTGRWLRGVIYVNPGSLLWEPASGVQAPPIDLTTATAVPQDADPKAESTLGLRARHVWPRESRLGPLAMGKTVEIDELPDAEDDSPHTKRRFHHGSRRYKAR